APTLDGANSGPRVGPVVLSEIHYNPQASGVEFVELRNISAERVLLFDESMPTNTWRLNGLGYVFPMSTALEPGETMLLVATNPASFRLSYELPETVLILGPYTGALQDSGER